MATPTHLSHKPIVSIDDYAQFDGIYANITDFEIRFLIFPDFLLSNP